MSTFEDQSQIGQRPDTPTPTVILQLKDGFLVAITGPHAVCSESYDYDWDPVWNEPSDEIASVTETISFRKTVTAQPIVVERALDFIFDVTIPPFDKDGNPRPNAGHKGIDAEELGEWLWGVLNGQDPRQ